MCIQATRWGLLLGLLVLGGACQKRPPLVPAPGEPPPLRVEFRPLAGRALTEVSRTERTAGRGGAEVAEVTTVTRFTPAEGGWLLEQRVERAGLERGGASVESAASEALRRIPLKVRLAADGTFIEVVDAEVASQVVREVVPAGPGREALEAFFAPEALEARAREEWEVKYGGLFRRNLQEGQRTWEVARVPLGGAEVTYLLERTVVGTEATVHGDALVLSLRCLDALPPQAPEALRQAWEAAGSPALTPGVVCEGEQVLARARFVPVRRALTLRARVGPEDWTLVTQSRAEGLEEEAAR